ncbi:hypothetical protein [Geodermatophilus sp. URMC 60]
MTHEPYAGLAVTAYDTAYDTAAELYERARAGIDDVGVSRSARPGPR